MSWLMYSTVVGYTAVAVQFAVLFTLFSQPYDDSYWVVYVVKRFLVWDVCYEFIAAKSGLFNQKICSFESEKGLATHA